MDSATIEKTAAAWFARQKSGRWSAAEQAELDAWLATTAHRIAHLRLTAAWQQAARLQALGAGVRPGTIPGRHSWGFAQAGAAREKSATDSGDGADLVGAVHVRPGRLSGFRPWTVAAALLLTVIGVVAWHAAGLESGTFSTPIGKIDTIPLADGSRIILNTDSQIRVALGATERRVELNKGEAFFDVAKDAARPFIVFADGRRIVAVGTRFAVRRHGNDIYVIVTEGRVRLEDTEDLASPAQLLGAGAVARMAPAKIIVRQHPVSEAEQALSWRGGFVTFRNTRLSDAVAEFNRYSSRKIIVQDASIEAIRIGGHFRSNNIEAFLWLLENGFAVNVARSDDEVVLTGRP